MKKGLCCVLALMLLTACSPVGMEATIEDAKEIAIDESGTKEEVQNLEATEGENYVVEFDTSNGHYTYKISKYGKILGKSYGEKEEEQKEEEKKEEKKEETKTETTTVSELTAVQKTALTNALANMGVTGNDVENVTVKNNADGTIAVTFTIKGGETVLTTVDSEGNLISSVYQ